MMLPAASCRSAQSVYTVQIITLCVWKRKKAKKEKRDWEIIELNIQGYFYVSIRINAPPLSRTECDANRLTGQSHTTLLHTNECARCARDAIISHHLVYEYSAPSTAAHAECNIKCVRRASRLRSLNAPMSAATVTILYCIYVLPSLLLLSLCAFRRWMDEVKSAANTSKTTHQPRLVADTISNNNNLKRRDSSRCSDFNIFKSFYFCWDVVPLQAINRSHCASLSLFIYYAS